MKNKVAVETRISNALKLPSEKKVYFNGFVVNMSASDILIGLEANNEPVAMLNTSLSVAKALSEMLRNIITRFEEGTDYKVPELKEMEERLSKLDAKSK